jgi:toxin ParE1/3/4
MTARLTSQARLELDEIWHCVAGENDSPETADRALDAIAARLLLLAEHPRLGRIRDDLRPGLRSYPAGQYVIFYHLDGADGLILRILHGSRDVDGTGGR